MGSPMQYLLFRPMGGSGKKAKHKTFIREWRVYRGLSQARLAEWVGLSQETASRIERGRLNYTQPTLEAFADALGCAPGDLLMRDPTKPNAAWTLFETLSEADKKQAAQIIETFQRKAG